jgi:nucleoid DNA-binding protein
VEILREKTKCKKKDINLIYDALVETMIEAISNGKPIYFPKFGKIYPYTFMSRRYYKATPQTGRIRDENGNEEQYIVPDVILVKFKMSCRLKWKLNPGVYSGEQVYVEDSD